MLKCGPLTACSNPHALDKTARKNCEIVYIDIAERRKSDDLVRAYTCVCVVQKRIVCVVQKRGQSDEVKCVV